MKPNYINHIAFVIDESGSMGGLKHDVVKVFDAQIEYLATRSEELDQETRASVYLFNDRVRCLYYDKDVLRLPSLKDHYSPNYCTALIDATIKAIEDLDKTPELYGDHSFLIYILSDGMNNVNNQRSSELNSKIQNLRENWTLAFLAPDQLSVREAKQFGFPANNIQVWDTTSKGIGEIGRVVRETTDTFMKARTSGVRGTKNLFTLDSRLNTQKVKTNLQELSPNNYSLLPVRKDSVIKDFVESWTKTPYVPGSSYYQLTKKETIQGYKQICVQHKFNGKLYGGTNARKLLGLPDYEIKVSPLDHGDYNIFIQSTSVNRKILGGTNLLVLK